MDPTLNAYLKDKDCCLFIVFLYKNQICGRCIFRLLKISEINLYEDKSMFFAIVQKAAEILGFSPTFMSKYDYKFHIEGKDCICLTCLGLLQLEDRAENIQKITSGIIEQNYQYDFFTLCVITPFTLCLRACYLIKYFSELWGDRAVSTILRLLLQLNDDVIDVKTVLKWILFKSMAQSLGKTAIGKEGDLSIQITYKCAAIDEEMKKRVGFLVCGDFHERKGSSQGKGSFGQPKAPTNWKITTQVIDRIMRVPSTIFLDHFRASIVQKPQKRIRIDLTNTLTTESSNVLSTQTSYLHNDDVHNEIFQNVDVQQAEAEIPNIPLIWQYNDECSFCDWECYLNSLPFNLKEVTSLHHLYEREVATTHRPIFVEGMYQKFSRDLPQSPWIIDGIRLYESSIQDEILKETGPLFSTETICFSSGGREDIDVRMLGEGRPFSIEFVDPHSQIQAYRIRQNANDDQSFDTDANKILEAATKRINANNNMLQIKSLRMTDASCLKHIKEEEIRHLKLYAAVIRSEKPVSLTSLEGIDKIVDLEILQKTPVRVLHRRSLLVRKKYMYRLKIIALTQNCLLVLLISSAGTYIKEFIHGDLGRTNPNLSDMLSNQFDIIQLDVCQIGNDLKTLEADMETYSWIANELSPQDNEPCKETAYTSTE